MGFFSKLFKTVASVGSAVLPFVGGGTGSKVASAIGSALGAYGASSSAAQTAQLNQQNYELAYNQLYNQHQIEVADLKAAGLNPILSANNGNTTFSPSYQQPVSKEEKAAQIASSAAQIRAMAANADNSQANAYKARQEGDLVEFQKKQIEANTALQQAQAGMIPYQIDNLKENTKNLSAQEKETLQKYAMLRTEQTFQCRMISAKLDLLKAQAYAAVSSGQQSLAQATAAISSAAYNYAMANHMGYEDAKTIAQTEGIAFDNALKNDETFFRRNNPSWYVNSKWSPVASNYGSAIGSTAYGVSRFMPFR